MHQNLTNNLTRRSCSRRLCLSAVFGLCLTTVALLVLSRVHAAPQEGIPPSASSGAQTRGISAIAASPAFSAQDLSAPPAQNWLKVGGSLFNQNWSPLKLINRENVGKLTVSAFGSSRPAPA